jgi:hypothetical protein
MFEDFLDVLTKMSVVNFYYSPRILERISQFLSQTSVDKKYLIHATSGSSQRIPSSI